MHDHQLTNLDVLIAAVEASPAQRINLDMNADTAPWEVAVSIPGMVCEMSHFRALGMVRLPETGLPALVRAGERTLTLEAAFAELFGEFAGVPAYKALGAMYGSGPWDNALDAWFPSVASHKQLALARLLFAREVATGREAGKAPPRAPQRVRLALGMADLDQNPMSFLANLRALLDVVKALRADQLVLVPFTTGAQPPVFTLASIVTQMNHFRDLGVTADPVLGTPQMSGPDGSVVGATECLNQLFGTLGRAEAYDALFRSYGAGCWDRELLAWFARPPGHMQLALARLGFALDVSVGETYEPNPGCKPPRRCLPLLESGGTPLRSC